MKKVAKDTSKKPKSEVQKLEALVGDFMHYWGFKKIHGRIWLHLYISTSPLDSAELMKRLKVSKGLMSLALRELLHYQVILPEATGRHGTVYYVANPNIREVINFVLRTREAEMLRQTIAATEELFGLGESRLAKLNLKHERIISVLEMTSSALTLLDAYLSLEVEGGEGLFKNFLVDDKSGGKN